MEVKERFNLLIQENKELKMNFNYCIEKSFYKKEEISMYTNWLNSLPEEFICRYLKKDGSIISVLKNPTDEMKRVSVNQNPNNIRFIQDQTDKIINIATNRGCFDLVNRQSVDICLRALKLSQWNYVYVKIVPNPDYETTLKNLLEKKAILEALK